MAPKKPTVTSSSTRSARVKGGSNPVVTKGEARTRAARASMGPAPKQRPMATGGTKGPLQGGTRTASVAKPSGMAMSGDRTAAIKGAGNPAGPRAPKPAFGPVPTGPSEARIRSAEAGPGKVRAGMGGGTTLSSKPGANAAKAQAGKDAARMANRTAKGYGGMSAQQTANINKVRNNLRGVFGVVRGAGMRGGVAGAGISSNNTADATLTAMAPQVAKQIAAMKNKVGPKIVGPKKVGTGKVGTIAQSFDKSFAAARKAGKSVFTFKGKKYNTKMK